MASLLTRVHALPSGSRCAVLGLLLAPDLRQLPGPVEEEVGGVPVPAPAQLEYVLLVHGAHVVIVTLEPGLALLSHPAHVVTAVTRPPLVCQHGLEDIVSAIVAAHVVLHPPVLVLCIVLGLSLRLLRLGPVLPLPPCVSARPGGHSIR